MGLTFLSAACASAQPPLDPPFAGRPTNFSQLTGRFTIAALVEPTEALVEDPIVLRVVIKGDVVRGEPPLRRNMRIFPEDFASSFYLEPVPERDKASPAEKTWEFVWKVRAKSTRVVELPSLALAFYAPPIGFQTARSEAIALKINERPKIVVEETEPRGAPASVLELAEWSDAESPWPARPRPASVAAWLALAMILAVVSWRRAGRIADRMAAERRAKESRLAASTVAELRQGSGDLAAIVTRFLQVRFGLAAVEPSAGEINALLKRHGIAPAVRDRWSRWYRAVAARRFAPIAVERTSDAPLRDDAIALIRSVETPS